MQMKISQGVLICLDCTEEVIEEAIRLGLQYGHLTSSCHFLWIEKHHWCKSTERMVRKAIKDDIDPLCHPYEPGQCAGQWCQ